MVTDYLEGKLAPDEQGKLEQHLLLCDPCVQYIEQTRQPARALGKLPAASAPPAARTAFHVERRAQAKLLAAALGLR